MGSQLYQSPFMDTFQVETYKSEIANDNALRISLSSKAEFMQYILRHLNMKKQNAAPNDAAAVGMISYLNTIEEKYTILVIMKLWKEF